MAPDRDAFNRQSFGPSLNTSIKQVRSRIYLASNPPGRIHIPSVASCCELLRRSHHAPTIATPPNEPSVILLQRAPLRSYPAAAFTIITAIA